MIMPLEINGKFFYVEPCGRVLDSEYELIKGFDNGNGYIYCRVGMNPIGIHRIVAMAYIPNPESKPQVNHKNGVKSDNSVWNLEWVTASENMKHSFRELGHAKPLGSTGISGAYTKQAKAVRKIDVDTGEVLEVFATCLEASISVGRRPCSINDALKGRSKTCAGFKWEYATDIKNKFNPRNKKRWEREQRNREAKND